MTERKGDWLQTYTGVAYWPLDPRVEEVDILDIAHALSNMCRYGGHTSRFYSVAEHSYYTSFLVPEEHALTALLHDATEAYLVDVPRPIKAHLTNYREIEQLNWEVIATKFWLPVVMPPEVHQVDNDILLAEHKQLMPNSPLDWGITGKEPRIKIHGMAPTMAKQFFLGRFYTLNAMKKEAA